MPYFANDFDDEVVRLLKDGGVGFMPSDTIYGLSTPALDQSAVERLHRLKERRPSKPFIILISDPEMLGQLGVDKKQAAPAEPFWPGPLTLVVEAPGSPAWLHMGHGSLAVRVPEHEQLRILLGKTGPIISSSANPEGLPPAENLSQALEYFGDGLDFYVDIGPRKGQASTIVRPDNGKLRVIRQGAIKVEGANSDIE